MKNIYFNVGGNNTGHINVTFGDWWDGGVTIGANIVNEVDPAGYLMPTPPGYEAERQNPRSIWYGKPSSMDGAYYYEDPVGIKENSIVRGVLQVSDDMYSDVL